jgi:cytochrome c-type biogenesis protein CcmE
MRSPARNLILGGAVIAAALGFLVYQGLANNLVYYQTPSELLARGAAADGQSLRLGGLVEKGTVHFSSKSQVLRFVLTDPKAAVAVISRGLPPEMFRAGIGVVVEGTYSGRLFHATNLMIKHGASYVAPKPGQTPVPDEFVSSP